MPKVSIIIPVYNAEKVLTRCLDSVLAQTFTDFEVLVMDDGSKDGTAALCDAYAAKDARIRVVHKENSGVSDTRNQALSLATGDYLQFLDADDWITPEATSLFFHAAETNRADLVISDFYRVVDGWTARKGSIDEEGLLTREEFASCMAKSPADYYYGVIWNKFFRRDIVEHYHLRMDEKLRWCEDFIFNMEYILHAERIFVLRAPTYYYVKTEGSLVQQGLNIPNIVRMKMNVLNYYRDFYKKVFSEEEYASHRPEIYGFLLDYSHDDGVIPFLPGSKRLGEEKAFAAHAPLSANVWTEHYYVERLFRRYADTIGARFDLEQREIAAVMFLANFEKIESMREFAEYLNSTQIGANALLEYLALKGYVRTELGQPESAVLTEKAKELKKAVLQAEEEAERTIYQGFSEEEMQQQRENRLRRMENMRAQLER